MTKSTLSPHQYNMLRIILQKRTFTLEEAAIYKQNTFGSMASRNYLVATYDLSSDTVQLDATSVAKEAMLRYESTDVTRANQSTTLSQFVSAYVKRAQRRVPRHAPTRPGAQEARAIAKG